MELSSLRQQCTICHVSGSIFCHTCQRHLQLYRGTYDNDDVSYLTGLVVGWHYDRLTRHLIHRLKYGRGRQIAQIVGSKLATIVHITDLADQVSAYSGRTIITAVPTHWRKRYITRGYNQAEVLAHAVAANLNLPYVSLLTKSRWTSSQVKVSRSRRLTNIVDSFASVVHDESQIGLIILVDDVVTTGATINECARILREQHPRAQIWGLCVARNRYSQTLI